MYPGTRLKRLMFEPGEDTREAGERLAASYVNFYIANEAVLVPQFQDKHDKLACDILGKLFPERRICLLTPAIIIGAEISTALHSRYLLALGNKV